jgi:GNAT superfamily N-acetyltransferase
VCRAKGRGGYGDRVLRDEGPERDRLGGVIRAARAGELPALIDIERAAGAPFRVIGMEAIADDDPGSVDGLLDYQRAGRAWVYVDPADRPVAYLIAKWVDGNVHIEQVSLHPDHAGRGIGRRLIEHVADWSRERGAPALTLTTFAEVAWNAPYYERCGFRKLGERELTAGLRQIRAEEAAHGLDAWPRVVMRREL